MCKTNCLRSTWAVLACTLQSCPCCCCFLKNSSFTHTRRCPTFTCRFTAGKKPQETGSSPQKSTQDGAGSRSLYGQRTLPFLRFGGKRVRGEGCWRSELWSDELSTLQPLVTKILYIYDGFFNNSSIVCVFSPLPPTARPKKKVFWLMLTFRGFRKLMCRSKHFEIFLLVKVEWRPFTEQLFHFPKLSFVPFPWTSQILLSSAFQFIHLSLSSFVQ